MSKPPNRPVCSYEDLRGPAREFLDTHHPDRSIPVPVEQIAEFSFDLNIVPTTGLRDECGVDGYLSADRIELRIDDHVFSNSLNRARFTVAHELGHLVLHSDFFANAKFTDVEGWKRYIAATSDNDYGWIEWQAYCFAGLILVPDGQLQGQVDATITKIEDVGLSIEKHWDMAWDQIENHVAETFEVSTGVIQKRMGYDGIREKYRRP